MATTEPSIPITGDPDADQLLVDDPFALVVGMLLDQQVSMETAFAGPSKLKARLGDRFTAEAVAAMDPDEFEAVCREKPAIHRFPKAMGARIHEMARHVVERYDGDPAAIWTGVDDGDELKDRVSALPGFGEEKTKIFIALLAKRLGVRPTGWEAAAAPFSDDVPRSIADVGSPQTLLEVREWKRAQKAAGKSKQD
ncbi:HhH-GPD-type base excision DNA repair protein [Actinomarinicola tropica]|uniref:Fe-S cluster assembly protein HesB n=1 Tax=Actinomarinicola tropica TaxID=2789776 RepID=A0A5Q2RPT1_9ACTN|nr:HhH-GPD-type base excision DNA repair protein [Actinomarinicola tropica]QGG95890.1 Fe-S cluster assembly protein HesB [Actinomarinicola tropica]